jgi:hypothetical protein
MLIRSQLYVCWHLDAILGLHVRGYEVFPLDLHFLFPYFILRRPCLEDREMNCLNWQRRVYPVGALWSCLLCSLLVP